MLNRTFIIGRAPFSNRPEGKRYAMHLCKRWGKKQNVKFSIILFFMNYSITLLTDEFSFFYCTPDYPNDITSFKFHLIWFLSSLQTRTQYYIRKPTSRYAVCVLMHLFHWTALNSGQLEHYTCVRAHVPTLLRIIYNNCL